MYLSNPPAVLSIDLLFAWYSKIANIECKCRLRIYEITFERFIVIVSELPDNLGPTITEEALTLIQLVSSKFSLEPTKTMWFRHYPKGYFHGYLKDREIYERLMLFQESVCLQMIDKQQIEDLLGVKLES